jgi:hypothetical protein
MNFVWFEADSNNGKKIIMPRVAGCSGLLESLVSSGAAFMFNAEWIEIHQIPEPNASE